MVSLYINRTLAKAVFHLNFFLKLLGNVNFYLQSIFQFPQHLLLSFESPPTMHTQLCNASQSLYKAD